MTNRLHFTDDNGQPYPEWEHKRLDSFSSFRMGFTPSTAKTSLWEGNHEWLSIAGMKSKYISKGNKKISDEAVQDKRIFESGTLIMSFKLSIGKLAILNKPMFTNEAICGFDFNNKISEEYAYQTLSNLDIASFGSPAIKGITLNSESIGSIICPVPSLSEQKKIADLLGAMDKNIELQAEQVELLKQQKQAVSHKIFTRQPGFVFTDDNGDAYPKWERKKLSEVGTVVTGNTPPTSRFEYWDGDHAYWITPRDIKGHIVLSSSTTLSEEGAMVGRKVFKGSTLITCIGSIGKMSIMGLNEGYINQQINAVTTNGDYDNFYIYYAIENIVPSLFATVSGTTIPILNKTDFSKHIISCPSLPEQKKIADLLGAMDKNIELQERQLVLLKQQKKAYSDRIFG